MKPRHSGKNIIDAPSRLAQPAHLAMFSKLECLFLVDRSWATAARVAVVAVAADEVMLMAVTMVEDEMMMMMALMAVSERDGMGL